MESYMVASVGQDPPAHHQAQRVNSSLVSPWPKQFDMEHDIIEPGKSDTYKWRVIIEQLFWVKRCFRNLCKQHVLCVQVSGLCGGLQNTPTCKPLIISGRIVGMGLAIRLAVIDKPSHKKT